MELKFAIGDRVKCIETDDNRKPEGDSHGMVGQVYTVKSCGDECVSLSLEGIDDRPVGNSRFTLHAKAGQFVAGDRVVRLNSAQGAFKVGDVGTVARIDPPIYAILDDDKPGHAHQFKNLRLATAEEIAAADTKTANAWAESVKVGDTLIATKDHRMPGHLTPGKRYTVEAVYGKGVHVACDKGGALGSFNTAEHFRPATEADAPVTEFKVGDRVRSKRSGREYPVLRVQGQTIAVPGYPGMWESNRFELVTEPAATAYPLAGPPEGGFEVGDLVECVATSQCRGEIGKRYVVYVGPESDIADLYELNGDHLGSQERFRLISRPDADGWHAWTGGENPVDTMDIEVRLRNGSVFTSAANGTPAANKYYWEDTGCRGDITAFRILPAEPKVEPAPKAEAPLLRQGDRVECLSTLPNHGLGVEGRRYEVKVDQTVAGTLNLNGIGNVDAARFKKVEKAVMRKGWITFNTPSVVDTSWLRERFFSGPSIFDFGDFSEPKWTLNADASAAKTPAEEPAPIDLSKARVGDFVTVRLKVLEVDATDELCPIRVSDGEWPEADRIIGHEPALKVGDAVLAMGDPAEIVFILGDEATVIEDGSLQVYDLTDLVRA